MITLKVQKALSFLFNKSHFQFQKIGMGGNEFTPIALGYGLALMIGILATGGVSGGHLNPAVTLSMAIIKKCKWIQVPVYMAAQYLGAFVASAVLYGNYYKFMDNLHYE